MAPSVSPVPEGYHTVTPYLVVSDANAVLAFIEQAFAGEILERHGDPEGRVMHAEVRIGDSIVMLGEGNEEWPSTQAKLHLYVEDVDAVFRSAVAAGAEVVREPEDMFYGDRTAGVDDAWGTQWWIATRIEDVSPEEIARRQR